MSPELQKEFDLLKQNISDLFAEIEKQKRKRRQRLLIGFIIGFIVASIALKIF